jgi:hypothetical protein
LSARAAWVDRRAEPVCRRPAPPLVPDLEPLDFEPLDLLDLEPPALVAIELLLRVAAIGLGET